MARHLGFKVVAEDVESVELLQFLCSKGCDLCQGYYCSRPLPEVVLEQFLSVQGRDKSRQKVICGAAD